jgi:hypothetical protein
MTPPPWTRHAPWGLAGLALLIALAAPGGRAGGVATLIVIGAGALLVVRAWQAVPARVRRPPRGAAELAVCALTIAVGAALCADALTPTAGWLRGDWGPQRAILQQLLGGGGDSGWSHVLSSGEAPLETYPALTYHLAAALARTLDLDALGALRLLAVLTHVAIAVGIARLALRVAPAPIAALMGALALLDRGALSAGSQSGIFEWGILHSAVGQAFTLAACVAVLDAVRAPRLRTALAIWIFTALAAAAHPSSLIAMAALLIGLGVAALLAHDVPARRPALAALHVVLGLALAAPVWMPLGDRLLVYGQHFANVPRTADGLLGELATRGFPWSSLPIVIIGGTVGLLIGLWTRRALPVLAGATGTVLLLLATDAPYLLLDLAPSQTVARLGATRLMALVRPWSFVGAALVLALLWHAAAARRARAPLTGGRRTAAIVAAGLLLATLARAALPWWSAASADVYAATHRSTDGSGEAALTAWARAQVAASAPTTMGRALFEISDEHYNYHLTAETGLPTLHLGGTAAILLRERMIDTSSASLRRFNIRWIIAADGVPSVGEPAGPGGQELQFGRFTVRQVPAWDGALARVEAGPGTVATTAITPDRVDVEVQGGPALVALGLGFYGRQHVRGPDGRALPIYACPATDTSDLRVPCAWLPTGASSFRFDGGLPSDGAGRPLAALALAVIAGVVALASRRRWRWRMLRRWAAIRARLRAQRPRLRLVGLAVAAATLLTLAVLDHVAPARALQLGTGLRSSAEVEVDLGAGWEACSYHALEGRFACPGGAVVQDSMTALLNDEQLGWPFVTPSIDVVTSQATRVRVRLAARLAGRYWAASSGSAMTLRLGDQPARTIGAQVALDLGAGDAEVVLEATVRGQASFTMVAQDSLVPARPLRRRPPSAAPF